MTLRLFAAREGSPTLWEIDDPSVFTDDGTALVGTLDTHPVDFGPAKGYGRLREFVQWCAQLGAATVTITPIADGVLLEEQACAFTLDVSGGIEQRLEAPFSAAGTRFAARISVEGASALFELGEADLTYLYRRSLSRGS